MMGRGAQSFDRLRMKGKGAQDDGWGAQSFDRLRMKSEGAQSFDRLRMKGKRLSPSTGSG